MHDLMDDFLCLFLEQLLQVLVLNLFFSLPHSLSFFPPCLIDLFLCHFLFDRDQLRQVCVIILSLLVFGKLAKLLLG